MGLGVLKTIMRGSYNSPWGWRLSGRGDHGGPHEGGGVNDKESVGRDGSKEFR